MAQFDAVFIGAGHNALAGAAHLTRRGWKVGLFEAADRPGGAVKTLELTEPGFRHDLAAMNLSLFAGSAFNRVYGTDLAKHGLEFSPVQDCFASVFPGGRWVGVSTDLATTVARIRAISERDARTWESLVKAFPGRAELIFSILGGPMKKRALARILFSLWRKVGLSGVLELGRFLLSSPRAWLDETFESAEVKALLGAWGLHLDFAPDIAGGAVFPYLEGMANQSFGMVLGKGGADTMVKALAAMVEAGGGTIECNARVERVLTEGGRATGVMLADGRRVAAFECWGDTQVNGIRIFGRADRIDLLPDGTLAIVDYKTGTPPSGRMVQEGFALQLGLVGLIAQAGGFKDKDGRVTVEGEPTRFEYWSLARNRERGFGYREEPILEGRRKSGIPREDFLPETRRFLDEAIARWILGNEPFVARLNPDLPSYADYDQLMRLEEWQGRGGGDGA